MEFVISVYSVQTYILKMFFHIERSLIRKILISALFCNYQDSVEKLCSHFATYLKLHILIMLEKINVDK